MKIKASLAKMDDEDIEIGDYDEEISLSQTEKIDEPAGANDAGSDKKMSTKSSTWLRRQQKRGDKDTCRARFCRSLRRHRKLIALFIYLAYFCYAVLRCLWVDCTYDDDRWTLILLTCTIAAFAIFYFLFIKLCWESVKANILDRWSCCLPWSQKTIDTLRWATYGLILTGYLIFAFVDCLLIRFDPYALISLAGVFVLFLLCGASSYRFRHKGPIRLQPIVVGLSLQFAVALIILRWPLGERFFTWLAHVATTFFEFANEGAKYVWSTAFNSRDLAFSVLPIIPFFAAFTAVLSYLGWLHSGVKFLAIILEKIVGTTAAESITCVANVFVGMAESPFLVYRFLPYMTRSELHAMMTGGFATIAVYMFGALTEQSAVNPKHLLAASLMAGPGALALSKLVYPEVEQSSMRARDIDLYAPPRNNASPKTLLEAIYEGASMSVSVVAHIAVNLLAIISMKALVNGVLRWFGARAGRGKVNLQFIASYIFWPISFLIGVPFDDCQPVAQLLGTKFFSNDPFTPYSVMANMSNNRILLENYYCQHVFRVENGSLLEPVRLGGGMFTLPATNATIGPVLSKRAETVATYALCGYANLVAIGIQIGAVGALSPTTKSMLATIAIRALLTATAVNLMNAATAGLLLPYDQTTPWNETCSIT